MTDFKEILAAEAKLVNQALSEYLDIRIGEARRLNNIHEHYYGSIKEYMMRGGKRLRPVLVTVACKAVSNDDVPRHLYRAACSLELLHNGSLLHDDLIDHDEVRRGGPTFHALYREWYRKHVEDDPDKAREFGMALAVLGGDSVLNMGGEMINASELPADMAVQCLKYYQTAYHELADGVLLEMSMVGDSSVTPDIYLEMVRLKTAVLFEKSLLMGATLGGATESQKAALSEFGIKVGQAFQIQDDILGSFGDESVTGKSADGDIREGKKTMLLLQALRMGTQTQRELLADLLGKKGMTTDEVEQVRTVFRESGALDACEKMMHEILDAGQNALRRAEPPLDEKYAGFLIDLSEFLVRRSY